MLVVGFTLTYGSPWTETEENEMHIMNIPVQMGVQVMPDAKRQMKIDKAWSEANKHTQNVL